MQNQFTTNSAIGQFLSPILNIESFTNLKQSFADLDLEMDKFAKKLGTVEWIALWITAQVKQRKSLREISACLADEDLQKFLGVDSISASQLSRRIRELPPQSLYGIFKQLVIRYNREGGTSSSNAPLPLHLIDSSTITLCLHDYRWAEFRETKGGIKIHLRLNFDGDLGIPDQLKVTSARPSDKTQMDALVVTVPDAINVFDRGYLDYRKFDQYCEQGVCFTTRLKKNAFVYVLQDYDGNCQGAILKDQKVLLGRSQNQMKHSTRLVEVLDCQGQVIRIITNDFKRTAEEIGDLYRNRWQIELFFKWIKQHLVIQHFNSHSINGVESQVYLVMITYMLLAMLRKKCGGQVNLLQVQRVLRETLHEKFESFARKLHGTKCPSKGRKVFRHEAVYQMIIEQIKYGMIEDYDYLTLNMSG